ncbi:ALK and LTK ligand 2b-like [Anguilla rostrata]|uniref:ALK and LTK ligand 2b-like n=1 Tax=Anguilla rostrata TaxID=7938 RepID=UPI0030CD1A85
MSGLRKPAVIGLILLICTAGYCKENTVHTDTREDKSLFERIMDIVRHAREHRGRSGCTLQHTSKTQEYSIDPKEVHDYKSYNEDQILEIFPRDLRKKEKFLKHFTGPLYFSPKCRKHVYRLYHNTRDCTIPAYYKRCARLLVRLAGSPRCTEG